jgi:peptidoglycan/xylan/chitin deacetylase (PgdA/CDA1 family)
MVRTRLHGGAAAVLVLVLVLVLVQLSIAAVASAAPLPTRPHIALIFDDAPTTSTPSLLGILEQREAKATFFLIGDCVEENPAQAADIAAAGMLVGSHSYAHDDFTEETTEEIRADLTLAQSVIHAHTGVTPRWFHSPFNAWNPAYNVVLPELGLQIAWPTINPKDWAGTTPQVMIDSVLASAAPGGVIQLHDMTNRTNTLEALPAMIDGLRAAGYELVTIDEQWSGTIEGTVTESGGPAADGAAVTAYDSTGTAVASATTDADGGYRLKGLHTGSYKVRFSWDGHVPCYYHGATSLAGATSIPVKTSYSTIGADAVLVPVHTPVTSILPSPPTHWVNHDVVFSLNASDAESPLGIATYYGLNAPPTTSYVSSVTVSAEGTTAVSYYSVDASGNAEKPKTAQVRIDKTKPTIEGAPAREPNAAGWYQAPVSIHFVAADGLSGVATVSHDISLSSEGASQSAAGAATDVAGNAATASVSGINIDLTPPHTTDDCAATYATEAVVCLTATDSLSGVAATTWTLDGGSERGGTQVSTDVPGRHELLYRSIDVAGNREQDTPASFAVVAPTGLSAKASATEPQYGSSVAISGVLRRVWPAGQIIAGRRVQLLAYGSGEWRFSAAATTSPSGAVAFSVRPSSKTSYRLIFGGVPDTYATTQSAVVTVRPRVRLGTPSAPKKMWHWKTYTVAGSLLPVHASGTRTVQLYRDRMLHGKWKSYGCVWAIALGRNGSSRYEVRMKLAKTGAWRLRAFAPADAGHAAAWSSGYRYVSVR